MRIELTNERINILNNWLNIYGNENKDATCTGIYTGITNVLRFFNLEFNIYVKRETVVEIEQIVINDLIEIMNINKIKAMWNIGVATGICWTLELFEILDSDYSNLKKERIKNENI